MAPLRRVFVAASWLTEVEAAQAEASVAWPQEQEVEMETEAPTAEAAAGVGAARATPPAIAAAARSEARPTATARRRQGLAITGTTPREVVASRAATAPRAWARAPAPLVAAARHCAPPVGGETADGSAPAARARRG